MRTIKGLSREEQLVAMLALYEAGNTFPVESPKRRTYHALSEKLHNQLKPSEGEADEAMYNVLKLST